MIFKKYHWLAVVLGFFIALLPSIVHAQEAIWCVGIMPGCGSGGGTDYENNAIFSRLIPNFITWIIRISIAGGVVVAIVGGVMVLISGGDEEMMKKGNKAFYFAGIGITVSLFAYLIVELINRLPFPNV